MVDRHKCNIWNVQTDWNGPNIKGCNQASMESKHYLVSTLFPPCLSARTEIWEFKFPGFRKSDCGLVVAKTSDMSRKSHSVGLISS